MKRPTIEITERKQLLVQLVAGLLSSGHYSEIKTYEQYAPGEASVEPRLKSYKCDWMDYKEAGYPRARPFYVLDDAEALLRDIEFIVDQEEAK